jgi:hypothetical protein
MDLEKIVEWSLISASSFLAGLALRKRKKRRSPLLSKSRKLTFIEAVSEASRQFDGIPGKPDQWIRPIAWRNTGMAIAVRHGAIYTVPGMKADYYMPSVQHVLADWEMVSSEDVLEER